MFLLRNLQSRGLLDRLHGDRRGSVAVLFGLAAMAVISAVGGGIDLARAYMARQKLSEVATLTCQYASRPSVVQTIAPSFTGSNGSALYAASVGSYINAALANQKFGFTQTNATPFTFAVNGAADVNLTSNVPTTFMKIVRVTTLPVAATSHCYDNSTNIQQVTPTPYVVQEGFEQPPCNGCVFYHGIPGHNNATSTSTQSSQPTYNGATGGSWYATGYCLETDPVGNIKATLPEGVRSAELECDNGSGTAGNSAISTKTYLATGDYELRYHYSSRVVYPDYTPAYLCGSAASDLSWANSTNSSGGPVANALRTNQINVYLDLNTTGSPPLHTTITGGQQLAGSNLIDMCVYSLDWIERSVRIKVTTPGFYWLTFAADGQNDSFGGQLDNIRLCNNTCPGAVQDNFPAAWLAANNGGVNKVLFQDTLESPSYTASTGCSGCSRLGNMNNSQGTSGTASSGWPNATPTGWATASYNQMDYFLSGAAQGSRFIALDAHQQSGMNTSNRLIARPFILNPGYYKVNYWYKAEVVGGGFTAVYCGATPAAAGLTAVPAGYDTNFVGVFMSHSLMASTPNGGFALNAQANYTNPNGTTSTTPMVAPNAISFSSYNAAQPNPLLDLCGYAPSWTAREASIRIVKPGTYWLTMSALGVADNAGGQIDDITLTALGSLAMASPPANPVTIPVPNPQPGAQIGYTGFYIIGNPLTVPAALP